MTIEQNKALMQRFLDCSIASDPEAMLELMSPHFVAHIPVGDVNREGFAKHNNVFNEAFSEKQIIVENMVAEGDMVIVRILWWGIQTGEFMGVPPSGKPIEVNATITERMQSGKLVEHWSLFDRMGMMQQLGLIPGGQPAR
jgi:predicted ester cyclase